MNWEMLAAIGQLAAVFVGIPSLIYLAVQIREQTKERRQSAVHALTEQWGDLTESPCTIMRRLAAIFLRGLQSFADLDAISKLRFSAFFNRLINIFEGMYFSHCAGHPYRIVMARGRANDERPNCLSGRTAVVGRTHDIGTRRSLAASWTRSSRAGDKPKAFSAFNLDDITKQSDK